MTSDYLTLEDSLAIHLNSKVDNWNAVFTFGKHRGKTFKDVFESDIDYLEWLNDESIVKFDSKIVDQIENAYAEAQSVKHDLINDVLFWQD